MNWTTEYPTRPGVYWIRNYQLDVWKRDAATLIRGPAIVQVDNRLDFDFTGDDRGYSNREIVSAEWFGPIQPPQETELGSLVPVMPHRWHTEPHDECWCLELQPPQENENV